MSQQSLRREARQRRRALNAEERRAAEQAVARRLLALSWFRRAMHVAAYLARGSELDLAPFLLQTARLNKRLYVPRVPPAPHGRLVFTRWTPDTPLVTGPYGIPEAPGDELRAAAFLDLVITPLVAFDTALNRVGQGAGYYDRSFAFLRHRHRWRRPLLVGAAFECQKVAGISPAAWDVPLDAVVTERRLYFRPGRA